MQMHRSSITLPVQARVSASPMIMKRLSPTNPSDVRNPTPVAVESCAAAYVPKIPVGTVCKTNSRASAQTRRAVRAVRRRHRRNVVRNRDFIPAFLFVSDALRPSLLGNEATVCRASGHCWKIGNNQFGPQFPKVKGAAFSATPLRFPRNVFAGNQPKSASLAAWPFISSELRIPSSYRAFLRFSRALAVITSSLGAFLLRTVMTRESGGTLKKLQLLAVSSGLFHGERDGFQAKVKIPRHAAHHSKKRAADQLKQKGQSAIHPRAQRGQIENYSAGSIFGSFATPVFISSSETTPASKSAIRRFIRALIAIIVTSRTNTLDASFMPANRGKTGAFFMKFLRIRRLALHTAFPFPAQSTGGFSS